MDDNRKDNFGDFFRSRLNDDSPAENQWNVPPDFVFEGAMQTIQQEKDKKKRRFLWIFLPLLGLLSFGGLTWYAISAIGGVENRLEKVEHYQEEAFSLLPGDQKGSEVPVKQTSTSKNEISSSNTDEPTKGVEYTASTESNRKIAEANSKNSTPKQVNSIANTHSEQSDEIDVKKVQVTTSLSNPAFSLSDEIVGSEAKPSSPELLPEMPLEVFTIHNKDLPGSVTIPRLSEKSSAGYWSLTVYGNLNRASLAMTGIPEGEKDDLSKYDQQYGGFGLGLQAFYQTPGRWSWGLEAGYNCFHNESSLQEAMVYDKNKEITDAQGLTTYEADLNIGTPLGDYDYAANFRVAGNIENEATIMNKTAIYQTLHTINIAGLARFRLVQKEKWNWYVGAGLRADFIFNRKHQMNTELYYGSDMMFANDMTVNHLDNESTTFYSAVGETGFEYFINKKLSLLAQGQYNTSFTNLRQQNGGANVETYLRDLSLGMGLRVRL